MRIAAVLLPLVCLICMASAIDAARAAPAPAEPTGPHPRMLLDPQLRAAWRARSTRRGPVAGAIELCDGDARTRDHDHALYMGSEWRKMLQACLVAWAVTGDRDHAATALKYFVALLDDLDEIGDGKGGDAAGIRDRGYAIRNLAPYTALAYDWLHDAPGMTPALRARARQRWAAWLAFFERDGYHPHDPGSNYHAGYLLAATTIAIAEAGEAGPAGRALWRLIADRMWGKDMAAAWAPGGVLDGGDWDEGWQYGPLSVAEYALAARIVRRHGVPVDGVADWLGGVLRRHVYALNPSDRLWVGGDLDEGGAYVAPSSMTLVAVALGDTGADNQRWAKGELSRLKLNDQEWLLYDALASIGEPPAKLPRATWPTWYRAAGTGTLFARTGWDDRAIWFVAACARTDRLDHRSPNAGNFVLSRGRADLIVDPSPYGSLSTLTGNAPAVRSRQLPEPYQPSQGAWGERVHWRWATRSASGVVAARCDYSDAFRFQDRPSDVPEALRDFVLLPSADGHDASLVIVDRAVTGDASRKMYLRFRVPADLALDASGAAVATIDGARLAIHGSAPGTLARTAHKDCFGPDTPRGNCDAARFPVTDDRVEIAGPEPRAVHVIEATGARGSASYQPLSGDGATGVIIQGTRDAVVVWPSPRGAAEPAEPSGVPGRRGGRSPGAALSYRAPRRAAVSHVVVLDAAAGDRVRMTAQPEGDACRVAIGPGEAGEAVPASPLLVTLDERCRIAVDPEAGGPAAPRGAPRAPGAPAAPGRTSPAHAGCCGGGAGATATAPAASLLVLASPRWRRRRHRLARRASSDSRSLPRGSARR